MGRVVDRQKQIKFLLSLLALITNMVQIHLVVIFALSLPDTLFLAIITVDLLATWVVVDSFIKFGYRPFRTTHALFMGD